jgi:hypothetical protein
LLDLGAKPKDRVGVIGANCPEWMLTMQGCNRTRCAAATTGLSAATAAAAEVSAGPCIGSKGMGGSTAVGVLAPERCHGDTWHAPQHWLAPKAAICLGCLPVLRLFTISAAAEYCAACQVLVSRHERRPSLLYCAACAGVTLPSLLHA